MGLWNDWIERPLQKQRELLDSVLDDWVGIDDAGDRDLLGLDPGNLLSHTPGAGEEDPLDPEPVNPPSSFGGDVLSSQERLRKQLALKMSTSKTNVTGGVRGSSQIVRPTLMTL